MILRRVSQGSALPVSLAEAKDHLRVTADSEDMQIAIKLAAAAASIAEMTGRAMQVETWAMSARSFSGLVRLPKSPVRSLDSVKYYDAANVLQTATLSDFMLYQSDDWAYVEPAQGKSWPIPYAREDAVTITFTAGYTVIPFDLRMAVMMKLADLYTNRGDDEGGKINAAIEAQIAPHRLGWIAA